jgi:hypothetical protein
MPTLIYRLSSGEALPLSWPDKAASQIEDYILDVGNWTGASTLSAVSVAMLPAENAPTLLALSFAPKAASMRLGGGIAGVACVVTWYFTAADGRTLPVETPLRINLVGEAAAPGGTQISQMAVYPLAPNNLPPNTIWSNGGVLCIT